MSALLSCCGGRLERIPAPPLGGAPGPRLKPPGPRSSLDLYADGLSAAPLSPEFLSTLQTSLSREKKVKKGVERKISYLVSFVSRSLLNSRTGGLASVCSRKCLGLYGSLEGLAG